MRPTIFAAVLFCALYVDINAQTPTAPPAAPPPTAAPKPAPGPATARPTTLTIQVTDTLGAPLADTQVMTTGPVAREGTTSPEGSLRLTNMRGGNYRLRFEREGSVTLERDLTMRNGESLAIDVSLTPAPPPPKAPEPVKPEPEPLAKALAPPGEPKVTAVPMFLDKNFIGGREGHKESALGCTATGTAILHQLREAWLNHAHEDADEWLYVVAGEGTLRLGSAENKLQAGTFSLIPYGTPHAVMPTGRNPLIVISVISGPPCKT